MLETLQFAGISCEKKCRSDVLIDSLICTGVMANGVILYRICNLTMIIMLVIPLAVLAVGAFIYKWKPGTGSELREGEEDVAVNYQGSLHLADSKV